MSYAAVAARYSSPERVIISQSSAPYSVYPDPFPEDYPVRLLSVEPDPVYYSLLAPEAEGWLGSDVGLSIPISPDKSVWLFGDTFVGRLDGTKRVDGAVFINNSIGIQDRTAPVGQCMKYYWREENGRPVSFFAHQEGTPGTYYWPTMGIMLGGELFIYCYSVQGDVNHPSIPGNTVIRISNPLDSPEQWQQQAFDIGLPQSFHGAIFVREPYVYFLGPTWTPGPPPKSTMSLARARTADILAGGLGECYEFWSEGPDGPFWSNTYGNLSALYSPGVTESAIQYVPEWDLFVSTTYRGLIPEIFITVSRDLTGPWSEPVCVYRVPEHQQVPFTIISYAVRPHPELSTKPGEIILSYATNAPHDIKPLFTDEGAIIYWPKFIRVQLEQNPASGCW